MSITMKVRNAVVALDDLDGEEFPCVVVEGEAWNGFAIPYGIGARAWQWSEV